MKIVIKKWSAALAPEPNRECDRDYSFTINPSFIWTFNLKVV